MLNIKLFSLSSLVIILCSIIILSSCGDPLVEESTTSKTDQQEADSIQTEVSQQQGELTQIITMSEPSKYFELTISPANVDANTGDEIEVYIDIYSLVNTPVEMNSIELVLYGPEKTQLRKQLMTMDSPWSGYTSYVIKGDEAYYRLTLNFTMPYVDNKDYSEYSAEFIPISID